jgi:spore coat protein CotF
MQQNQSQSMDEKTILTDLLIAQKQRMSTYCTLLAETSSANMRMMLQDLLIEAAEDQFAIYQILTQRGWYTAKQAQQSEIDQARQQVMQMKTSIQS